MDCNDLEACSIIGNDEKNSLLKINNYQESIISDYEYNSQQEILLSDIDEVVSLTEINESEISVSNKNYYEQSFQEIKDDTFNFNASKEIQKHLREIDRDYEKEVTECVKILPQNFETARGRARCKQLQNLSPKQRKMEEKVRLIKNKYCAKKIRVKRNENLLKLESQVNFFKNKINNYEYLFQELLSKIK